MGIFAIETLLTLNKKLARQTAGAAVPQGCFAIELPPEPADIPSFWRAYNKNNMARIP